LFSQNEDNDQINVKYQQTIGRQSHIRVNKCGIPVMKLLTGYDKPAWLREDQRLSRTPGLWPQTGQWQDQSRPV